MSNLSFFSSNLTHKITITQPSVDTRKINYVGPIGAQGTFYFIFFYVLKNPLFSDNNSCNQNCLVEWAKKSNEICDPTFKFIRKGQVGAYKEDISQEYNEKFDEFMKKSNFKFDI